MKKLLVVVVMVLVAVGFAQQRPRLQQLPPAPPLASVVSSLGSAAGCTGTTEAILNCLVRNGLLDSQLANRIKVQATNATNTPMDSDTFILFVADIANGTDSAPITVAQARAFLETKAISFSGGNAGVLQQALTNPSISSTIQQSTNPVTRRN